MDDALKRATDEYRAALGEVEFRRHQLREAVRAAVAAGMSISEASRVTGVERSQVRRWLA